MLSLKRAVFCPFLILVLIACSNAVDPVDFLESLKDDEDIPHSPPEASSTEYPNGVNVIPGEADVNYPTYSSIPKSSFSCIGRPVGFYADTELRCQVWHICDEEQRQQSFLCTNGTVYSQDKRVCDWWYNVNCDPSEVSRNYEQNYDLYKGPPPKSDNDQGQENKINDNYNNGKKKIDFDEYKSSTTKAASKDPFYSQSSPSSRQNFERRKSSNNNNDINDQEYFKPTPSYDDEPSTRGDSSYSNNDFQPSASRRQSHQTRSTTTTTYRPPTTYSTPPPPAALQGGPFSSSQTRSASRHNSQPQQREPPKQGSFPHPPPPPPNSSGRAQPSIKTSNANGKRIVEIRVPLSQIPPEILAKYGKRIPEHILKEIFLNFTRGQQSLLKQEALSTVTANPTGAGNSRSSPPKAPIPQNNRQSHSAPPSPVNKKPVDFDSHPPSTFDSSNVKPSSPKVKSNLPPPPPPPSEPQQKFRHSTPRKVDGVKFATPTRELLADYEDERQQVGESQNPIYSYQQLFNAHNSRKSHRVKESFSTDPPTTTTTTTTTTSTTPFPSPFYSSQSQSQRQHPQQPYQDVTRAQPRRRVHTTTTSTQRYFSTTEEPELITDRYFPVSNKEEKMKADIRRIFLIAKQGIQVLPPIPVLSKTAVTEPQSFSPQPTARRFPDVVTRRPHSRRPVPTTTEDFSKIPPPPKVGIPEDYYVKKERFQEAESRFPGIPSAYLEQFSQPRQRPTTTTTSTTTTTTTTPRPPPPPTPYYEEPDFFTRRTKPNKPQQNRKKVTTPSPEKESTSDYDDNDDGIPKESFNTEELELLRLAQEYIELTGQEFGVRKQPRKFSSNNDDDES